MASGPTADLIQAKLAVLAASSDLSDEERKQAKELYQQALSQVQAAKRYIEAAAAARQLQQSAPAAIAKLQQQPRNQPPAPPSPDLAPNELAQRLTAAQTEAGEARKRLADLDEQLTVQQGRLKAIPVEVANFQQQMADSDNQVKLAAASATPNAVFSVRSARNKAYKSTGKPRLTRLRYCCNSWPKLRISCKCWEEANRARKRGSLVKRRLAISMGGGRASANSMTYSMACSTGSQSFFR